MPRWIALTPFLLAAALASPLSSQPAPGPSTPSGRLQAMEALYPPWQRTNNDAADRGLVFTVAPVDVLADFHGSLDQPDLVLYVSGNYFFAVRGVVDAFGDAYPRYRGHVYYETLPPGLLLRQMDAGGTVTSGNMTWTVKPDVFMAELSASNDLVRRGKLATPVIAFATNDLTIMVPAGNPAHVSELADLGQAGLALVMPNPQFEGIAWRRPGATRTWRNCYAGIT
jgi:molybdate transport system substrate-binding protein